jgi:hypothetical protein
VSARVIGSARDRERRLTKASEEFMRGILSAEEFERIERENMPNYDAAIKALAKSRPNSISRLWRKLRGSRNCSNS